MIEPKAVDFKPRWARNVSAEDAEILDQFSGSGSLPVESPQINTRIFPRSESPSLTLRSLGEVVELTQKLSDYAGVDCFYGPNPNFSNLRSVPIELTKLTKLTSDPFLPGSFIIPARLEAEPYQFIYGEKPRFVSTEDIVKRFGEIIALVNSDIAPTGVSIGALQTLEKLHSILKREASAIEFSTIDSLNKPISQFELGESFVEKVRNVLFARRSSLESLETLTGQITALDLVKNTLYLSISKGNRVKGNFSPMFTPSLIDSLNRKVKLQGRVERRGNRPTIIHVESVEILDSDED